VKLLIGKDASHTHVNLYETLHRTKLHSNTSSNKLQYQDPTKVVESDVTSKLLNHPEEYLAMQLSHAKKLAKAAAGETVVDTVVTVSRTTFPRFVCLGAADDLIRFQVPAFFTHAERKAMLDAIELAGLKPLALIDDGSAGMLFPKAMRD
jgi:molecular chaperone DnaK (HSP70)